MGHRRACAVSAPLADPAELVAVDDHGGAGLGLPERDRLDLLSDQIRPGDVASNDGQGLTASVGLAASTARSRYAGMPSTTHQ